MLLFSDIPQSYVDAESEAEYVPENLDLGFFDFRNTYSQLTNILGPKCFISGRKGTGKSAYIYRIKKKERSLLFNLHAIPYRELKKMSAPTENDDLKYAPIWRLLIISFIAQKVNPSDIENGLEKLSKIKGRLKALHFSSNVQRNIRIATQRKKKGMQLVENSDEYENSTTAIFDNIDSLDQDFSEIKFKKNFYFLIDGSDDVLMDTQKNNYLSRVLGSLFTVVYEENLKSKRKENRFKIIMAVRSDIWGEVNGSDMNKRAQTNKLDLEWISGNQQEELAKLINTRLSVSSKIKSFLSDNTGTNALWKKFFPEKAFMSKDSEVDSWTYFLEYSLYRPRDVIQFIEMAKENYPDHSSLTRAEFVNLVNQFSKDYFWDEMRNEMAGLTNKKALDNLSLALQNLGRDGFTAYEFIKVFNRIDNSIPDKSVKELLQQLFDHAYIGQRSSAKDKYTFKHKFSHQAINYNNSLVIHRGLYAAVDIN